MKGIETDILYEDQSFPNAWVRAMMMNKRNGKVIHFGGGKEIKEAKDISLTVVLEGNALQEALNGKLHPQFPTKERHKEAYIKEWERNYDWRKQGFTYCYEDRCEAYKIGQDKYEEDILCDQWKLAREDLAEQIRTSTQSNRNVIVIGNPSIDRFEIPESPPCLREIWIRFEGFDKSTSIGQGMIPLVSIETDWRSRDLGSAWPVNIIGLLSAIKREILEPNGAKLLQYRDHSRSLHVYSYDWPLFDAIRQLPIIMR